MYAQYFDILGIPEDSTLNEIKAAFREKAKEYHPDLNQNPDAGEKFIAINEAYTFLLRLRSSYSASSQNKTRNPDAFYNEWVREERIKARQRAAERAKMKFEEYRKSPIYKTTSTLNHMVDSFIILFAVFIILAGGFGLYTQGLYIIEDEKEVINARGIFIEAALFFIGFLFISLAMASIKKRRRINRN